MRSAGIQRCLTPRYNDHMTAQPQWNSNLYQSGHSFVWGYGRELLTLLSPKPGERILDIGCGTGQLTSEIAQSGAQVVGIDSSPEMIAAAQRNCPNLRFDVAHIEALDSSNEFDAVFSNAALHWVRDQQRAIGNIAHALKPGGRFVFEMGGRGNLGCLLEAAFRALTSLGVRQPERLMPWHFPSIGEYASLLESRGFRVRFATLFERPTVLDGGERGLANWIEMFGAFATEPVAVEKRPELISRWIGFARPMLFHGGEWVVDYWRLRMLALLE